MKINEKTIKVALAFALVIVMILWAASSVLPQSYSGANLNFGVGSGSVSVTNPSPLSIPVQLTGTGTGTFRVASTIDGVSGSSTRQGSGRATTQLFEFALPSGVSEFTVARGTNVAFAATTDTRLEATVQPVTGDEARTTIIVAIVVVLGALFYISRTTNHRWISIIRSQRTSAPMPMPVSESAAHGQGHAARAFGDNRADTGD